MKKLVVILGSFVLLAYSMQSATSNPISSSNGGSDDENLSEQGAFCEECLQKLLSQICGPQGLDEDKLNSLNPDDLLSLVQGIVEVFSGNGLKIAVLAKIKDIDADELKTVVKSVLQVLSKLLGPFAVNIDDLDLIESSQLKSLIIAAVQVFGGKGLKNVDLESIDAINAQGTKALVVDLIQISSEILGLKNVDISKISEIPAKQIKAVLLAVIQAVGGAGFQGIDTEQLMDVNPELFAEANIAVFEILATLTGVEGIDFGVIESIPPDQFMTLFLAALQVLGDDNGLKGLDLQELRNIDANQIAEVIAGLLEILATTTDLKGYNFETIIKAIKPKYFKTIAVGLLQTIGGILGPQGLKGTDLEQLEGVDPKKVKTFLVAFLKLLSKTEGINDIDFDDIESISPKQFKTALFAILKFLGGQPLTKSEIDELETIDADELKAFAAAVIEVLQGRGGEKTIEMFVVNAIPADLLKDFVIGIFKAVSGDGIIGAIAGVLKNFIPQEVLDFLPTIFPFLGGYFQNASGSGNGSSY